MDDSSMKQIKKNFIRIKEGICDDLDTFVDELIQKDIFDMDTKDKLDSFRTPKEKSDKLIRMVVGKGTKACNEFILLLQKKKYEYVLFTREEAESEDSGSGEKTFVYRREMSLTVTSQMEDEGASGEVQVVENSPREMSTRCLEAMEKNTEETLEMKYKFVQKSYIAAKELLETKIQQITKLKREKKEVEKNLEKAKYENKDLKHRVKDLQTKIVDLEMLLKKNEKEMSATKEKMNKLEEMLKEDREWKNKLEKEVNGNREALDKISDYILNMELVRDKNPPNIDNSKRKQQLKTGAKPKSNKLQQQPFIPIKKQ